MPLGRHGSPPHARFRKQALAFSYYITSRALWGAGSAAFIALEKKIRDAMAAQVDYVQVREKDLPARHLLRLVEDCLRGKPETGRTRLLVNSRADVAVAAQADGVHFSFASVPLAEIRNRLPAPQTIGVSCHNEREAEEAGKAEVDYLLLGPVFATPSKPDVVPLGTERFHRICRSASLPVFALGGVDRSNASDCVAAGAKGIAGIRLFQNEPDLHQLVEWISRL